MSRQSRQPKQLIEWAITDAVKDYLKTWWSKHTAPGDLQRFAAIKRVGLDFIDPIFIRRYANGWRVMDGHHRLQLAVEEGRSTIRATVADWTHTTHNARIIGDNNAK